MARTTLDELVALGEELLAGMARMRETVDAMGWSLSVLERTVAELRQDVTRLRERVDRLEARVERVVKRTEPRKSGRTGKVRSFLGIHTQSIGDALP